MAQAGHSRIESACTVERRDKDSKDSGRQQRGNLVREIVSADSRFDFGPADHAPASVKLICRQQNFEAVASQLGRLPGSRRPRSGQTVRRSDDHSDGNYVEIGSEEGIMETEMSDGRFA